jgi:predicted transcriptional regulator
MTPRAIAKALEAGQRSVENECSIMRSLGVLTKHDGRNGGYTPAVKMLPGDRETIAALVAAYGGRAIRVATRSIEADAVFHPFGRCRCCGEGRCEWCIDIVKREGLQR